MQYMSGVAGNNEIIPAVGVGVHEIGIVISHGILHLGKKGFYIFIIVE